ncbi:MAG TPA: FMN reductase [Marmoricola sp.]
MTNLVVISAGLSEESSTRMLADRLTTATVDRLTSTGADVSVDIVELRPLAHQIMDAMLTGFASGELAAAVESVRAADALIAVTPVFSASYSGLFKSFFDVLEPGLLDGLPVLLAATAGTERHSLVLDHALRPLFSYLHAEPLPTAVFAATGDWGSTADGALQRRIDRAGGELAGRILGAGGAAPLRSGGPVFDDASPEFVDLEALLAR